MKPSRRHRLIGSLLVSEHYQRALDLHGAVISKSTVCSADEPVLLIRIVRNFSSVSRLMQVFMRLSYVSPDVRSQTPYYAYRRLSGISLSKLVQVRERTYTTEAQVLPHLSSCQACQLHMLSYHVCDHGWKRLRYDRPCNHYVT